EIPEDSVIWSEDPFITIHDYKSPKCNNCARKLKSPEHPESPPIFHCQNNHSCAEVFCCYQCYNIAMSKYHVSLCGKSLSSILSILDRHKSNSSDPLPFFILKLFSIAKTSNIHPLDIPQIQDLAQYRPPKKSENSFLPEYYFELYFETLRILDISLYDVKFDFWVYVTLTCKVQVNLFGNDDMACLFHYTSLINHSCMPNVFPDVYSSRDGDPVLVDYEFRENNMDLVAVRDIRRGEEIVLRYCDPMLEKWERAMHLIP
ncbi:3346_t:CDS:1, partial [Acaulospora morrowiae]